MAEILLMPKLGLTMTEGTVSKWLKKVGDPIKKGDGIVEIETDKISNIVEANEDGFLLRICIQEGEIGPIKAVLGVIGQLNENVDLATEVEGNPAAASLATPEENTLSGAVKNTIAGGRVLASPLARKMARDKGIDLALVSGTGPKGRVVTKDIEQYEVEIKVPISPTAAKIANDLGVDISTIQKNKRIMKTDIIKATGIGSPAISTVMPAISAAADAPAAAVPENGELLKGMRKVIAKRLGDCWKNVPHVHHTVAINMSAAGELREKFIHIDKKFSFTDLVIKAMGRVLEEYKQADDSLVDGYLIHNENINIGVAVAVDKGLLVPVIKNVNYKSLRDIHHAVGELARKARENKLLPEECTGGISTVSNLGMYGCDHFTPILNPPEATILGVCRVCDKAVVIDGEICIAPMMNVVLGYDHRVVDGALAGLMTSRLREYLENPLLLL